jgi:tetraacyldisaccharide 4'-kinase
MLARWLQRQWFAQRRLSPALWLLAPLAGVYSALAAADPARARPERLPVPVIVVGNITVGGAGKTPLTLWLARRVDRTRLAAGDRQPRLRRRPVRRRVR